MMHFFKEMFSPLLESLTQNVSQPVTCFQVLCVCVPAALPGGRVDQTVRVEQCRAVGSGVRVEWRGGERVRRRAGFGGGAAPRLLRVLPPAARTPHHADAARAPRQPAACRHDVLPQGNRHPRLHQTRQNRAAVRCEYPRQARKLQICGSQHDASFFF